MASLQPGHVILSRALELMEAFKAFDADNDGWISEAELAGVMGSLGYEAGEQEVKEMMKKGDTYGYGLLGLEEFLEINTKGMDVGEVGGLLRAAFEVLDLDENGVVSGEELYEVVRSLDDCVSLEECKELIASIDGDGDGAVSFEDFKLILNALL